MRKEGWLARAVSTRQACPHCGKGRVRVVDAERLRQAREAAGISQADVAREHGCSRVYINRVEAGEKPASGDLLAAYERAIDAKAKARRV